MFSFLIQPQTCTWKLVAPDGMVTEIHEVYSMDFFLRYRLVGLVVKASASRAEDPGFESCLRLDFFESYQ